MHSHATFAPVTFDIGYLSLILEIIQTVMAGAPRSTPGRARKGHYLSFGSILQNFSEMSDNVPHMKSAHTGHFHVLQDTGVRHLNGPHKILVSTKNGSLL